METLVNLLTNVFIFVGLTLVSMVLGIAFVLVPTPLRRRFREGHGFLRAITDSHRYFYRWWPWHTVGFYLLVAAVLVLLLTAGCAAVDASFQWERTSQGARTPLGEKVEKPEFISGQTTVVGQGAWESGGVGGTFRGWGTDPSGKVEHVNKKVP